LAVEKQKRIYTGGKLHGDGGAEHRLAACKGWSGTRNGEKCKRNEWAHRGKIPGKREKKRKKKGALFERILKQRKLQGKKNLRKKGRLRWGSGGRKKGKTEKNTVL